MHSLKLGVVKNISGYSLYVMNLSNYFKSTLELKKRKNYYVLNSIQFNSFKGVQDHYLMKTCYHKVEEMK